MSATSSGSNPYHPPRTVHRNDLLPESVRQRPKGMFINAIICIVLGALGLLGALSGIAGLVVNHYAPNAFSGPIVAGPDPQMQEFSRLQQSMQQDMLAVNRKYLVFLIASSLAHVLITSGLLVGGILCLQPRMRGHQVLKWSVAAALVFEMLRAGLTFLVQRDTMAVMDRYMTQMMSQAGAMPPGTQDMVNQLMTVSMWVGVAMALVFTFAKVGYYAFVWQYLRRDYVRAWFESGE